MILAYPPFVRRVSKVNGEFFSNRSEIFLKPFHREVHGPLAVVRLCQPMIGAFEDMNLFGSVQTLKDLPGLVHGDELILLPMNHHAV